MEMLDLLRMLLRMDGFTKFIFQHEKKKSERTREGNRPVVVNALTH